MLAWQDNRFTIGNRRFQTIVNLSDLYTLNIQDGLILGKPRRYIDKYCEHFYGKQFRNIFELGIFKGGSTIFLGEMFRPEKLVAIDFNSQPIGVLDRYALEPSNQGKIHPFYGVDQSDTQRLSEIYQKVFGNEQLDLVIDDASHFLEETRTSFNYLFPRLRAGGVYIIEDWSWAHMHPEHAWFKEVNFNKQSIASLIINIILASASAPELFDEIIINDGFAIIRKGQAKTHEDFNIHDYTFHKGNILDKRDYFI